MKNIIVILMSLTLLSSCAHRYGKCTHSHEGTKCSSCKEADAKHECSSCKGEKK